LTDTYTSHKITAANGAGKSCRLLGLPGDAQTNFTFPHANHACYAVDPACPVRSEHQVSHCLSAAHHDCRLYRSYQGLEGGDQSLTEAGLKAILNLESPRRARLWSILGFAAVLVLVAVALLFSGDILASLASGNPAHEPDIQPATPTAPVTLMAAGPSTAQPLFLPLVPDSAQATATASSQATASVAAPQATASVAAPQATASVAAPQATSSSPLPSSPAPPLPSSTPASSCGPPDGWLLYTVQSGDSLYRLSVAAGVSIDQLREANCLVVGGLIYTGQRLYLPRLPVPTAIPSKTPTHKPDPTEPPAPTETEPPVSAATPTETEPPVSAATPTATEPPVSAATPTQPPPTGTPVSAATPTETLRPEPPTATPLPTPTFAPTPTPYLNTLVP
jgi:LysM repeat protein